MTTAERSDPPDGPEGPEASVAADPRLRAVIDGAPPLRRALLDEIRDLLPAPGRRHGGEAGDDAA